MSGKARILVVEDDALIALDLTEALKGFGYDVLEPVPSGKEAVDSALADKPDLILMDINLVGDMDGVKAAETIHASRPIPLVFLTALSDEGTLQRAKVTGPYGYLIKPFDPAELRSTIEIALDRYQSQAGTLDESEDELPLLDAVAVAGGGGSVEEKAAILRNIAFLSDLSAEKLLILAGYSEIATIEGGFFIQTEAGKPEHPFIVLTGRVSITKTSVAGKELILTLLGPGDCFGLLPLIPSFNVLAAAQAQLDSKILTFSRHNSAKILKEVPDLVDLLFSEMSRRLNASYELAMSLAHSRVETRILGTLSTLVSTLAKGSAKSKEVRIFITRRELADLTGTTPETAIRVTKHLERDGVLDLTRPGIIKIPDVEKLRALL